MPVLSELAHELGWVDSWQQYMLTSQCDSCQQQAILQLCFGSIACYGLFVVHQTLWTSEAIVDLHVKLLHLVIEDKCKIYLQKVKQAKKESQCMILPTVINRLYNQQARLASQLKLFIIIVVPSQLLHCHLLAVRHRANSLRWWQRQAPVADFVASP